MTDTSAQDLWSWNNLWRAYRNAARGKRGNPSTAAFDAKAADHILELQEALRDGTYRPGCYTHFYIHDPKRRRISAAPFRDRVVHHALINLIEPRFEHAFIGDSFANRCGKGTHRAIDRCQSFAQRFRYVLRADVVQYFAAIDHALLLDRLRLRLPESALMALSRTILASGEGVLDQEYDMVWFPGDDLLAACRPRGLPIGNLTSQFWANVYLDGFDHFVKRELRCKAYLRYVDDFALFADNKATLWTWRKRIIEYLAGLRLTLHERACQVAPVSNGIPWLGFVVYPTHRKLKARKARFATRRLGDRYDAWRQGAISFAELDSSVQGWVNHVRYADTWGLRREVFRRMTCAGGPGK